MTLLKLAGHTRLFVSLSFSIAVAAALTQNASALDQHTLEVLGMDKKQGAAGALPWADDLASSTSKPDHLTLALKYVTYIDGTTPIVDAKAAQEIVRGINGVYQGCNLHFRVEEFVVAQPKDSRLDLHPSTMAELDRIRTQFADDSRLVVINTGSWNTSGGLGADGANAWTMMPGEATSGAVIEGTVSHDAPLVAHELGHYLNLDHVSTKTNLMSPVIYSNSTTVDRSQCDQVRASAQSDRSHALRTT